MNELRELSEAMKQKLQAAYEEDKHGLTREKGPVYVIEHITRILSLLGFAEDAALLTEYRREAEAYLAGLAGMC